MLSRRLLRIKVIKLLYWHFKSGTASAATSGKNLTATIDKTYDLYFQMMWLIVDVARYADKYIDIARQKKLPTQEDLNPNMKFVENAVIRQIENSNALCDGLTRRKLGWVNYPELIRNLYNELVASEYYAKYMSIPERTYKQDIKLVEDFYVETVQDNALVEETVEDQSLMWADDVDFALILVVRTLGDMRANQTDIPVLQQYKNDDDRVFATQLLRKTIAGYDEYISYIDKYTQNWDVDRIAFTDNLIMATAIAELVGFPSIPVKVTLDEYIEIAKHYSTRNSGIFINGILDKTIEALTREGKIAKTGRGLI